MKPGNILKIETLGSDWCDKDTVMLHACFQLLTDCIQKEKLFEMTDFDHSEHFQQVKKEIDELNTWWQDRVQMEQDNRFDPALEKDQYAKDTEMLVRLVKIREYLWT
jgi:hypothetical protein